MGTSRGPENHPSGGLEFLRKCHNGLTNRHSAFDQMMITKTKKLKIVMKNDTCAWTPNKVFIQLFC